VPKIMGVVNGTDLVRVVEALRKEKNG
jgi:hypothetical protein